MKALFDRIKVELRDRFVKDRKPKDGMNTHWDTWMDLHALGTKPTPYRPTYRIDDYINDNHRYYSQCPVEGILIQDVIDGWLSRDDALKIYEMAYFSSGDILELGTNRGLSSYIMSKANHDSGLKKTITTVDLQEDFTNAARNNLKTVGFDQNVAAIQADAVSFVSDLIAKGKKFSFVFIDHSHEYEFVLDAAQKMKNIVSDGGFCLYHDFNDARNYQEDDPTFGVFQGATEGMANDFDFYGMYGCTALYRKRA